MLPPCVSISIEYWEGHVKDKKCTILNWKIFRMSDDRICHWWDKKESAIHVYGAMKEEKARTDELDTKSNQLQARVDERGIC